MTARHLITAFFVFGLLSGVAQAGVTIHYQGKAASAADADGALRTIALRARTSGRRVEDASAENTSLTRVIDEREVPYRGPVRGIVLWAAPNCEPFYVQFDASFFMQSYVKTQFAGAEVHIQIVELLHQLKPFLLKLEVEDEGEYWESRDQKKLEGHIKSINDLMIEMKRKSPGLRGPVTLPDGRIVDLMR